MKTPSPISPLFPSTSPTRASTVGSAVDAHGVEAFSEALGAGRPPFSSDDAPVFSIGGRISPSSLTGRELVSEDRNGVVSLWTPSRDPRSAETNSLSEYRVSNFGAGGGRPGLFPADEGERGLGIRLGRSMVFARLDPDGPSEVARSIRLYPMDPRQNAGDDLRQERNGDALDLLSGNRPIASLSKDMLSLVSERLTD